MAQMARAYLLLTETKRRGGIEVVTITLNCIDTGAAETNRTSDLLDYELAAVHRVQRTGAIMSRPVVDVNVGDEHGTGV
jgi:hypothetical protein